MENSLKSLPSAPFPGFQLSSGNVIGIDLNHVALKCRNARFHVEIDEEWPLLPTLRNLGPRMEKIKIHVYEDEDDIDAQEWAVAWGLCPNLEVIIATEFTLEEITAIMGIPKLHLKEISISFIFIDEDGEAKEIIDKIAAGTSNVEILGFRFDSRRHSLDIFDKLIEKNKSALQSITILGEKSEPLSAVDVWGFDDEITKM